jgi:hypothetical protein
MKRLALSAEGFDEIVACSRRIVCHGGVPSAKSASSRFVQRAVAAAGINPNPSASALADRFFHQLHAMARIFRHQNLIVQPALFRRLPAKGGQAGLASAPARRRVNQKNMFDAAGWGPLLPLGPRLPARLPNIILRSVFFRLFRFHRILPSP